MTEVETWTWTPLDAVMNNLMSLYVKETNYTNLAKSVWSLKFLFHYSESTDRYCRLANSCSKRQYLALQSVLAKFSYRVSSAVNEVLELQEATKIIIIIIIINEWD